MAPQWLLQVEMKETLPPLQREFGLMMVVKIYSAACQNNNRGEIRGLI